MTGILRRTFIGSSVAGAAGFCLSGRPASADDDDEKKGNRQFTPVSPITVALATDIPGDHPFCTRLRVATKKIVEDTDGHLSIRMITNGRVGVGDRAVNMARSGQVALLAASPATLAKIAPDALVSTVGFAFPDSKTAFAAMDGDVGAAVRAGIAKAGFHVFDKIWSYGYRQVTSAGRAIATPDDLKQFKIAVPDDATGGLFEALGAAPMTLKPEQIGLTLRKGNADGRECELGDIGNAKLYEYQRYCSVTNHIWDGIWLLTSVETWKKFPPAMQAAVAKNFDSAAIEYREELEKSDAAAIVDLKGKGMEFNQTDAKSFRLALNKAGYYNKLKGQFDRKVWTALEKHTGKLA